MSRFLAGQQSDLSLSCFLSGFQLQNGELDKSLIYLFVLNVLIAYVNQVILTLAPSLATVFSWTEFITSSARSVAMSLSTLHYSQPELKG